jgi:hypothetical protein
VLLAMNELLFSPPYNFYGNHFPLHIDATNKKCGPLLTIDAPTNPLDDVKLLILTLKELVLGVNGMTQ